MFSKKLLFLLILPIVAAAIVVYATPFVPYSNEKAPTLSLPDAYERAIVALGPATNQFHCISASIQTFYGADGEWFFTFYSTNSPPKPKWITVEFNGKVHVKDILLY